MGLVLAAQGRLAEAAMHLERSIEIYSKVHGTEEHPDVATSLNGLGMVLKDEGRLAEAAAHLERSLAIYIKVHAADTCHPYVAQIRRNLQSLRDLIAVNRIKRSVWTFPENPKRAKRLQKSKRSTMFSKTSTIFFQTLNKGALMQTNKIASCLLALSVSQPRSYHEPFSKVIAPLAHGTTVT
jgi:tetratricopeptide (TPR) repeat protein